MKKFILIHLITFHYILHVSLRETREKQTYILIIRIDHTPYEY